MRRTVALVLALGGAAPLVASRASPAQLPPAQPDSAASDSARVHTAVGHGAHEGQLALYALVIAPAGLVTFAGDSADVTDSLPLSRDHFSFSLGAGLASGSDGPMLGASGSGSLHLELFRSGTVLALRAERYMLANRQVDYLTIRMGHALRPRPRAIGGVTVGFRFVPRLRRHQGVEIAFPFIAGGRRSHVRLESAWVISLEQVSWSYQVRYDRRIGTGPWTIGLNADLEDREIRNHGRLSHYSVGVVLGRARL
jgi:hypothetical protein